MLSHKTIINIFKKIEIISSIFTKYGCMKLEMNYKKKCGRFTNICSFNTMNWRRNQRRKKIILRQMRMENNIPKLMKYSKSESKRDVSRDKQLHYPRINNLNWYHKELDKEEQTKSKVSGRKKVTNVRGEISEIEDLHK